MVYRNFHANAMTPHDQKLRLTLFSLTLHNLYISSSIFTELRNKRKRNTLKGIVITCWASALYLITVCRGGQAGGFYVAGWVETSCVWRDAVPSRSARAIHPLGIHYFFVVFSSR